MILVFDKKRTERNLLHIYFKLVMLQDYEIKNKV